MMVTYKTAEFFFLMVANRILLVSVDGPYNHGKLEMFAEKLAELKKIV